MEFKAGLLYETNNLNYTFKAVQVCNFVSFFVLYSPTFFSTLPPSSGSRIRWCGHVLRMKKEFQEGFEHKSESEGKRPRRRPTSKWEQQVRKDVTQREGRTWWWLFWGGEDVTFPFDHPVLSFTLSLPGCASCLLPLAFQPCAPRL
jgi:hypothetical protein